MFVCNKDTMKKAQTSKEGLFPPVDREVSRVETANVE